MNGKEQPETSHRTWSHAPSHIFIPGGAYIVTAGTYQKALLFDTEKKLDILTFALFTEAEYWGWDLQAWAVMANHYHFVALAPTELHTLTRLITSVHSKTAILVNRIDGTTGRRVWFQYWDTVIRSEPSYLARLNYVHHNAAKHGIVRAAEDYRWCSMGWFRQSVEPALLGRVLASGYDRISIQDDY